MPSRSSFILLDVEDDETNGFGDDKDDGNDGDDNDDDEDDDRLSSSIVSLTGCSTFLLMSLLLILTIGHLLVTESPPFLITHHLLFVVPLRILVVMEGVFISLS